MGTLANVWQGRAGLALTYWGFGVGIGVLWAFALSLVRPGSWLAVVTLTAFAAYYIAIYVGVWRAAARYEGLSLWAWLARAAVALGFLMIATVVFALGVAAWETATSPAPATEQSHTDKEGKPCSEITEFLGECKRKAQ